MFNESAQAGVLLDSATLNTAAPGTSYALIGEVMHVRRSLQLIVDFIVTASTGTTEVLDVKLQHSADGTNWLDITGAAFTQFPADASHQRLFLPDDDNTAAVFGPQLRLVAKVGGTTPVFTVTCIVTGKGVS